MHRYALFAALPLLLTLAIVSPPQLRADESEAKGVLTAAAAAMREVEAVEYNFVYGNSDDPTGWVTGTTRMRQVTDPSDSWLHVSGIVHAQPRYSVTEQRFDYTIDGERAYLLDHTGRTFQTAPIGAGGNSLSLLAVYGFITEFVETDPLWKERRHATAIRLLEPETLDGVACDVVRLEFDGGSTIVTWWFGTSDRLPRKGEWLSAGSSSPPLTMRFGSIRTGFEWSKADFRLEVRAGYEDRPVSTGGNGRLPDLALTTPEGETVRLAELDGKVLVLDFWNTWCYICRTQAPAIVELATELGSDEVRFFGVNVFETGDAAAYWRRGNYPYPTLLDGDDLAYALDLPYQPGIAVIDGRGEVVFSQLGGTHDRATQVRRAIGSARMRGH